MNRLSITYPNWLSPEEHNELSRYIWWFLACPKGKNSDDPKDWPWKYWDHYTPFYREGWNLEDLDWECSKCGVTHKYGDRHK